MSVCRRCVVSGRVQGVFYRATTRSRAQELGVTGWARNRPDGRVEVLACGDSRAVETLCDWLWQGPGAARVDRVECEPAAVDPPDNFTTR
jgi:acylphosphatase